MDEPSLNNDDNIVDFTSANHNSNSFKFKQKITDQTGTDSRKNVTIWCH